MFIYSQYGLSTCKIFGRVIVSKNDSWNGSEKKFRVKDSSLQVICIWHAFDCMSATSVIKPHIMCVCIFFPAIQMTVFFCCLMSDVFGKLNLNKMNNILYSLVYIAYLILVLVAVAKMHCTTCNKSKIYFLCFPKLLIISFRILCGIFTHSHWFKSFKSESTLETFNKCLMRAKRINKIKSSLWTSLLLLRFTNTSVSLWNRIRGRALQ